MINYREILRLDSLGYSQRSIASGAKASRNTVSEVLKKAEQLNISWPLDDDVTNEMLDELFYGKRDSHPTPYAVINYRVHSPRTVQERRDPHPALAGIFRACLC